MSASEGENSSNKVIQVYIESSLVTNVSLPEPQAGPDSNIENDHELGDSGEVHDYSLVWV